MISNSDAFDFVEADIVGSTIVEFRGAGGFVTGDALGVSFNGNDGPDPSIAGVSTHVYRFRTLTASKPPTLVLDSTSSGVSFIY